MCKFINQTNIPRNQANKITDTDTTDIRIYWYYFLITWLYSFYLKLTGSINTKQRNGTVMFSTIMRVDFDFNIFSKSRQHVQIERLYSSLVLCSVPPCTGPITCWHSVAEPNWEITWWWWEEFKISKLNLNFKGNNY